MIDVVTLGKVKIGAPLPGHAFFDYNSLFFVNYIPMLFVLVTHFWLRTLTKIYSQAH